MTSGEIRKGPVRKKKLKSNGDIQTIINKIVT